MKLSSIIETRISDKLRLIFNEAEGVNPVKDSVPKPRTNNKPPLPVNRKQDSQQL